MAHAAANADDGLTGLTKRIGFGERREATESGWCRRQHLAKGAKAASLTHRARLIPAGAGFRVLFRANRSAVALRDAHEKVFGKPIASERG